MIEAMNTAMESMEIGGIGHTGTGDDGGQPVHEGDVCTDYRHPVWKDDRNLPLYFDCTDSVCNLSNREWGQVGTNYFRGLLALGFQGFFMMVCVGIYAVLVSTIQISDNMHSALFGVAAYTVILCFSLMKTGNLSRSIFNAH